MGEIMEIQPKDTSRGHFYVSLVKSALRVVAGGNLALGNLFWAGIFLILAEVLGVVEELV
jgi:predicted ATP-dependent Lon-type protease